MPRKTVTDAHLLEHARAVFLDAGASARVVDVAHRAGVSEALLFKRFGTREGLFTASMADEFTLDRAVWLLELERRGGAGDVRDHLIEVGLQAIAYFERMMPVVMMTWTALPDGALERHADATAAPYESRRRVEVWFENELRLGRIRRCDTEMVSRVYLGALYNQASWEATLGPMDPRPMGRPAFVRGLVHLLWSGLAPEEAHHAV